MSKKTEQELGRASTKPPCATALCGSRGPRGMKFTCGKRSMRIAGSCWKQPTISPTRKSSTLKYRNRDHGRLGQSSISCPQMPMYRLRCLLSQMVRLLPPKHMRCPQPCTTADGPKSTDPPLVAECAQSPRIERRVCLTSRLMGALNQSRNGPCPISSGPAHTLANSRKERSVRWMYYIL